MSNSVRKEAKGFTIIEVMIVLLIAGLIILIVFLAIPALQRNSRNTQRRSDVAAVLAAVNEWSQNNNGSLPSTGIDRTAALDNARLSIFKDASPAWTNSWPTTVDGYSIALNQKCATETTLQAQNRSVAVLYRVETGGGGTTGTQQCEDS